MNLGPQRWFILVILIALCCPISVHAQAPVASNFTVSTVAGVSHEIDLYLNTTWSGGQTYSLAYTNLTKPQHGVVTYPNAPYSTYSANYQCTNLNYLGTDSFTWRAANGSQTSQLATCSITVVPNTAPVVQACSFSLAPGTTKMTVYLSGYVTHPDADNGQPMTYFICSQPAHGGSVSLPDGSIFPDYAYTAPPGFMGTDTFTWAASDGIATSAPAVCTMKSPANTVPVATPRTINAPSGVTVTNAMLYTDPDSGQTHTALVISQPAYGMAIVDAALGGVNVDYCSAPGFLGTDTFTFAICDGVSTSAPAVCTMNVQPNPPVALNQTAIIAKNTTITNIPMSFSGGGGYTYWPVFLGGPYWYGSMTTTGNLFTYKPPNNWVGSIYFKWNMAYSNAVSGLVTTGPTGTCTVIVKDVGSNTNFDWTQWRFDECHSAQSPMVITNQLQLQWQRTLPTCAGSFDDCATYDANYNRILTGIDNCRPVQMGKQLFVPCMANDSMSAYNTETGAQNWRYYTSGVLRRPPLALVLTNGTNVVIFGCDDGFVYCLNAATGAEYWKFQAAPKTYKAMGFGRLSSVWPVYASPVAYSNRVYFVAGYYSTWNLFGYCLDPASGTVIWKNDNLAMGSQLSGTNPKMTEDNKWNTTLGPLGFSAGHTYIYGTMDNRVLWPWLLNPSDGQPRGFLGDSTESGFNVKVGAKLIDGRTGSGQPGITWFMDGTGVTTAPVEPMTITAGAQTFTPATIAALGVPGTIGSLLAGDKKLFVSTTDGNLYCFGANVVQTNVYVTTVTPLPTTNDTWTAVVQQILASRADLGQGLALVWGVGSGRLVTELAQQAPGLTIVAADPDFAKLQALRAKMDAAGWSGARVSTVQGNPMDCGFAPYQAALIASEDLNVAGWSNGVAMAKTIYKATRPFGGQIWLPTNNVAQISAWLSAANLPTCSNGPSYQVTAQSVSGLGLTCIQRTGLPDANVALKPPFRLIAFGPSCQMGGQTYDAGVYMGAYNLPVNGVKEGRDLYSWLPVATAEPGYQPVCTNFAYQQFAWAPNPDGAMSFGINAVVTNPLFGRLEYRPRIYQTQGVNGTPAGANMLSCSPEIRSGSSYLSPAKYPWLADSAWGMMPIPNSGDCHAAANAANGMAIFSTVNACLCNQAMLYAEFGFVSSDETNDEQWTFFQESRTMRAVHETPVQSIGINFGALGDRCDTINQLLWTHHPLIAGQSGVYKHSENDPLIPVIYRGNVTNKYYYSGNLILATNNHRGWGSAAQVKGMASMTIPLAQPLIATRAAIPPTLDGVLTDACWSNAPQINFATACDNITNATRTYCMVSYDATNLYVAGVMHDPGPRPFQDPINRKPVFMKVALGDREQRAPPAIVNFGDYGYLATGGLNNAWSTNAWTAVFATNTEMFAGEVRIPWTNLVASGIWTSQLVMNVEICGNILNYNNNWHGKAQITNDFWYVDFCSYLQVAAYLNPVYFDVARGSQAETIPHTVRLYFAEMEGLTNGQRKFDVQLQGQPALSNLDVAAAAGGGCREVIREFPNVGIADKLNIDFVAHAGQPILNSVEILTTGTNAANQSPVAAIDGSILSGPAPLVVDFSARRSYDPDGQIVECAWDTGDGRLARGSLLHHVFAEPGTYTVSLLVLDNGGATAATNITVSVTPGVPAAFVCSIRSNNAPNGDYNGIFAWGTAMVSDLTSTQSLLFAVSALSNYVSAVDDFTAVTFTGGGTGVLRHINHALTNLAYITVCKGVIQTGLVTCASGHKFAISDLGHQIYTLVAEGYNDWPQNGNTATTSLPAGWTTDPNHCVVIRAAPGQGHTGTAKDGSGNYTGVAFINGSGFSIWNAAYTRIMQIIDATAGGMSVGPSSSVNRVWSSAGISTYYNGVTLANSYGGIFKTGPSIQDVSLYNCTVGSYTLGNLNAGPDTGLIANRVRAVNCLATSSSVGFTTNALGEIWLNHCISLDGSASGWDGWNDGNVGNQANQTVTFVNAANNNYLLAASDTGARGKGQPGLGADITGNLRTGPSYDVGAHQTTNALLNAFQLWQLQYFGSLSAPAAASNVVNSAGISNYQLFLAGSNPADSNTWFRFTALAPVTGSKWGMNFNTVSGKSYTVAWKTNLLDGLSWRFYTNFSGLGGSTQIMFTNTLPQAFFQIQAQ